jgi:hypothetical protein
MEKYYFTNNLADRAKAREVQKLLMFLVPGLVLDNPFYGLDGDTPSREIAELDAGHPTSVSAKEIVDTDENKIANSAGIIAYATRYSWGSTCECYLAYKFLSKPVYIIVPPGSTVDPKHFWVTERSTKVFTSVTEFIQFAKENLVPQKVA